MPNYVDNRISVFCAAEALPTVQSRVMGLVADLSNRHEALEEVLWDDGDEVDEDYDRRTCFEDLGTVMGFQSAWKSAESVQDRLFEILIEVHSSVIVKNVFTEESDAFWGLRYLFLLDGVAQEVSGTEDDSEELSALLERMEEEEIYEGDIYNDVSDLRARTLIRLATEAESDPSLSLKMATVVEVKL